MSDSSRKFWDFNRNQISILIRKKVIKNISINGSASQTFEVQVKIQYIQLKHLASE